MEGFEKNDHSIEFYRIIVNLSIGTLWKKIKSVVVEMSLIIEVNRTFDFRDYQDFDAKTRDVDFSIESCSTCVSFPIGTLWEEIKRVVTEKHEFDSRDKPIMKANFGIFILSEF